MTDTPDTHDVEKVLERLDISATPSKYSTGDPLCAEAASLIRQLRGERDALWAERDELDFLYHEGGTMEEQLSAAEAEVSRLRARLGEAERVIAPFAEFAKASGLDKLPSDVPLTNGSSMARKQVTVADFRAARAFQEANHEADR